MTAYPYIKGIKKKRFSGIFRKTANVGCSGSDIYGVCLPVVSVDAVPLAKSANNGLNDLILLSVLT